MSERVMKNRLAQESSPYLLQHAENPVDWYPWGDEAFARAEEEDKPVFLSIGYSTCHWCHVMERECFDDVDVADLMNRAFVSIKVDREERPEIDSLYMKAAMLLTGGGGWPLNLLLTPERKPFFAATYIPKVSMGRHIGMTDLIPRIEEVWKTKRSEVLDSAESVMAALRKNFESRSKITETDIASYIGKDAGPSPLKKAIQKGFTTLSGNFDETYGGFGGAPKFPQPHVLRFLLKAGKLVENQEAATAMVEKTLRNMRSGGIYDHLGFGFHRYSTDREWKVPHFEKMLYDQALLISTYLDGCTAAGKHTLRKTAEEVIQYLLRDMLHQEGGFYSAEDADSEGVEGKFYLWETNEFKEVVKSTIQALRPEMADEELERAVETYATYFRIQDEGNYREEHPGVGATAAPTASEHQNILFTDPEKRKLPQTPEEFEAVRKALLSARKSRIRPFLDDKVLTDWNGLVILALAKAGRVLEKPAYTANARETADFILSRMVVPPGESAPDSAAEDSAAGNTEEGIALYHRYRQGKAGIPGTLDDYAFLIAGLLELYRSDGELKYLEYALGLTATVEEQFRDRTSGGYFTTAEIGASEDSKNADAGETESSIHGAGGGHGMNSRDTLIRQKEGMDNAIPSGNSLMLGNLITLYHITGDQKYREAAEALVTVFSESLEAHPTAHTWMLTDAMDLLEGPAEVVICGKEEELAPYLQEINRHLPEAVVLRKTPESAAELAEIAPFTSSYPVPEEGAAVYICSDFACRRPISSLEELKKETY